MGDVRWMFHATAMGVDYDAMLGPLAHLFGARVLHRQQLEAPVGRDGGMTWIGDNAIEIGSPYGGDPRCAPYSSTGSVAACIRWRSRWPTSPRPLRRIEPLGVEVAVRLAHGLRVHPPRRHRGLVIEWGSHVQDDDPRFGAPVPVFVVPPVVNGRPHGLRRARCAIRCSTATARGRARHRPGDYDDVTGTRRAPHFALDLGDCMLALYPVPPDEDHEPRGLGWPSRSAA